MGSDAVGNVVGVDEPGGFMPGVGGSGGFARGADAG